MDSGERGAVAIVVAVFVLVAMVLLAFVVDRGLAYAGQNQLQNAVDAAALAAAAETCLGKPQATVKQVAIDYASANGVTVLAADVLVRDGGFTTGVSVRASAVSEEVFGGVAGVDEVTIGAIATASRPCVPNFALFSEADIQPSGASIDVRGDVYSGSFFDTNTIEVFGNVYAGALVGSPDNYIKVTASGDIFGDAFATGTVDNASNISGLRSPGSAVEPITAVQFATALGIPARIDADRLLGSPSYQKVTAPNCNIGVVNPGAKVFECTGDVKWSSWPPGLVTLIADEVELNGSWDAGDWDTTYALIVGTGSASKTVNFGGSGDFEGYIYVPNGSYDVEGGRDVLGRAISREYMEINGNMNTTKEPGDAAVRLGDVRLTQ